MNYKIDAVLLSRKKIDGKVDVFDGGEGIDVDKFRVEATRFSFINVHITDGTEMTAMLSSGKLGITTKGYSPLSGDHVIFAIDEGRQLVSGFPFEKMPGVRVTNINVFQPFGP